MKRNLIIGVIIVLILCACEAEESNPINGSRTMETDESIITEYYDNDRILIQRVEYNKISKLTTITDYYWLKSAWGDDTYIDHSITIIDVNGNIVLSNSTGTAGTLN